MGGHSYLDCPLDHLNELEGSVSGCHVVEIVSSTKQAEGSCKSQPSL